MKVQQTPAVDLTYCLNAHPGESWAENFAALFVDRDSIEAEIPNLVEWIGEIDATLTPRSAATGVSSSISVSAYLSAVESYNIVGAIEGDDPDIGDDVLVVGAHIDHIGSNPSMCSGTCLGADDNASGSAVVMEVARLLADCAEPARTILFALWNAEEVGLLGSKHYVDNPIYPLGSTIGAYIVDMVGAGAADGVTLYGGADPANSWLAQVMAGSAYDFGLAWPVYPMSDIRGGGSDHASFQEAGIPAVCEMSGSRGIDSHTYYHTPNDTIANVDMAILEMSASFLAAGVMPIMEGTEGRYTIGMKSAPAPFKRPRMRPLNPRRIYD